MSSITEKTKNAAFDKSQDASLVKDEVVLLSKVRQLPSERTRPMVVLRDGRLLTVERGMLCFSSDNGQTWEERPIFNKPVEDGRWEIVLLRCASGAILLVYLDESHKYWAWDDEKHEPIGEQKLPAWATRSDDEGQTWSEPIKISDGYCGAIINIIQTSTGRIVVPIQQMLYNPGRHGQTTCYSDDDGRTWQQSNLVDIGGHGHHDGCFEASVVELNDGRLWMLLRTNLDRFWQAWSEDQGQTWGNVGPTDIDASSSPGNVLRLKSGRLMMVWNRVYPVGLTEAQKASWERAAGEKNICETTSSWHRSELSIAFSNGDPEQWTKPRVLIKSGRVDYPSVLEPEPGLIWVTTRLGQQVRVEFNEADLIEGTGL